MIFTCRCGRQGTLKQLHDHDCPYEKPSTPPDPPNAHDPAGDPELDRVLERLAYLGQGIARDFDTTLPVALPSAARLLAAVTSAGD